MCGLAGIVDLRGDRTIDPDAVARMTAALAHRGPDGEGVFAARGVRFGHRRLAIIDKDGGAQPFHAQDGAGVLVFNGEIYNYQALARRLEARGTPMRTRSDTEVLAEGLAREGADFIHELRGAFAFAYWNGAEKTLLLARDRLGEKPLYYAETGDGFLLFASEIGALVASGMIAREIDPEALADYFYYGYVPDPKTIYDGVRKLPPGHRLRARRSGRIVLERYWRPVFAPSPALSFEDASDDLRDRLDEAVRLQMVADAPLGAFLSGGVDSSGVVAAMAQNGTRPVTCTVGFDDVDYDESAAARIIAERFATTHQEMTAHLDAAALIDDVARGFGEPFADVSALPAFLAAKLASGHVAAALSGDGGDEIFAGYRRYPFFIGEERLRALAPRSVRRAVFGPAGALYPKLDWVVRPLRFKTTFQALGESRPEGYARAVAITLPDRVRRLFSADFRNTLNGYRPQRVIEDAMKDATSEEPLLVAQCADLSTWLAGRMLVKADRMSMAHSLEIRAPLLDHKLVEWAGLLPASFKFAHGSGKRVLKAALAPRLGDDVIGRRKQGFTPPLAAWLRAREGGPMARLEDSSLWREAGVLDAKAVSAMAEAHRTRRADCAQELWSVIMFDAFLRNGAPAPSSV